MKHILSLDEYLNTLPESYRHWLANLSESDLDHQETYTQTGFWGKQGSGCLFVARSTGRICIALRSQWVLEPRTYGTWGGAMDEGETPVAAATREAREEAGVDLKPTDLIPILVFTAPKFKYHNFIAMVEDEFEPEPEEGFGWETEGHVWCAFGEWPEPLHVGIENILKDAKSVAALKKACAVGQ